MSRPSTSYFDITGDAEKRELDITHVCYGVINILRGHENVVLPAQTGLAYLLSRSVNAGNQSSAGTASAIVN